MVIICVTVGGATDLSTKLLLRILTSLEDVKQTLKDHSLVLHSLMCRGSGGVFTGSEVPDGLNFPLQSYEDVDNAEDKLSDASTRAALVSRLVFCITYAYLHSSNTLRLLQCGYEWLLQSSDVSK